MFLYFDNDIVKMKDDAVLYPSVKALYKSDRTGEGKIFFQKCITYMYYAYKKDGDFCNMYPTKRKEHSAIISETNWKELEENPRVKAMIDFYVETQYSLSEKLYEGIKKDMEELLKSVNDEPFVKYVPIELEIDIPESLGSTIMVKYPIKQKVAYNNAENKMKLLKISEQLMEMEDRLKKKVSKDNMQKTSDNRMFDGKGKNN